MGLPVDGAWNASYANANDYAGTLKWGTGSNPVHEIYGEGPPLRVTGREPGPDESQYDPGGVPADLTPSELYGYTPEDIQTLEEFPGRPPPVGTETSAIRDSNNVQRPPWGPMLPSSGTQYRMVREGAEVERDIPRSYPTETVSEGWENKLSGSVNAAETSNPAQYERQTSMQQVNPPEGRNNKAATTRGTDAPRANILTRLTGMKIKPWSTGERLRDMFPYQQDMIVRPFWYRTAATDNPLKMQPNEMYVSEPVTREAPALPYTGMSETQIAPDYGYSQEDVIPYA